MIVTGANEFVGHTHDCMPALLSSDRFESSLNGEVGTECLQPVPNEYLQKWPVSKRVNSSRADADDPTLVEAVALTAA